ncbi:MULTISPECIES: hypothetical protein [Halomonadaceae]|jgi:hypothetical protein|uniref:Uncharacterized protein n=1 Tax=Onishia taeanensis TaxID=284577 RepID=A0A328XEY3_9GAMM|nr:MULTISPECIES: hypothetical protein [Halomonas]MDI4638286.1 hypothetical protein [Halomonas sp. BMC7]NUJ59277.1 hypothetical protein [Halomonas taeanensis]RAR57362.1 hypothetical protein BCL93_11537 [Halomonas taeanensis]
MKQRRFLIGASKVGGCIGATFTTEPTPINLEVPPYRFLSEARVKIGVDPQSMTA